MIVDIKQLGAYLRQDADLIPLNVWNKQTTDKRGRVIKRGKTPLYPNWTTSEKNTAQTLELIKKSYNVGYRLGNTDLIIDVDERNYKDNVNSLEKLEEFLGLKLIDKCPTVITGSGGYHFYLYKPADITIRETVEEFPGIEFKTKGRQVVTAGSKHPNGNYYQWDDFAPNLGKEFETPNKLLTLLQYELPTNQPDAGELNGEQLYRLLEQIPIEGYADNSAWFPILCAAHHGTNGTGLEEFLDWSLSDLEFSDDEHLIRCRWASLGEKHNKTTIATLYKEVLAHGGNTAIVTAAEDFKESMEDDDFEDLDDFDDVIVTNDIKTSYKQGLALDIANNLNPAANDEDIIQAIRAALQAGTIEKVKALDVIRKALSWNKGQLNEIIKQIQEKLADDLGRILAEKTFELKFYKKQGLVMNTNGDFWKYSGTHWFVITPQYVGLMVTQVLDEMRNKIEITCKENALVNEAVSILGRLAATDKDILRLRERPYPVVNCSNGELWIKSDGTSVLKPHRPRSKLLQVLNVEYKPGATCPLFDVSIRQIFENFEDTEEIVRHVEEWMGYVLHPDKRPAKWWLFKGPGGRRQDYCT